MEPSSFANHSGSLQLHVGDERNGNWLKSATSESRAPEPGDNDNWEQEEKAALQGRTDHRGSQTEQGWLKEFGKCSHEMPQVRRHQMTGQGDH